MGSRVLPPKPRLFESDQAACADAWRQVCLMVRIADAAGLTHIPVDMLADLVIMHGDPSVSAPLGVIEYKEPKKDVPKES